MELMGMLFVIIHLYLFSIYLIMSNSFLIEFNFLMISSLDFSFIILLDKMSISFLSFIFLISAVVMFYSKKYMETDYFCKRFVSLVFLFILSMSFLVLSPSLLMIMLGWDGLGVISFLLVVYYQNLNSVKSGLITIVTNRFGDVALLMSIYYFYEFSMWNFEVLLMNKLNLFLIFFLLMSGMTKSAQFPFSAWLPAAMSAPTPISALVHSSTLVTAGVYLLMRFYYILFDFISMGFLLLFSLFTSFMAGLIACIESDLKKVVAMSTLSQLGLMMYTLSMGEFMNCFFHMLCHALFKSLLFLSCGMMIFLSFGSQDSRSMSVYSNFSPSMSIMFMISSMSLFGLPFLSGFYSKDSIIDSSLFFEEYLWLYFILIFCCVLTMIYSLKLMKFSLSSFMMNETSFSFSENFLKVFFMILLSVWSIIIGKFFSTSLLISYISFFLLSDKLMGLFILFLGFMFFLMLFWKLLFFNVLKDFLAEVTFMNWFMGSMMSSSLKLMKYGIEGDMMWLELLGPKNLYYSLILLSHYSFMKKFSSIGVIIILAFLFVFSC